MKFSSATTFFLEQKTAQFLVLWGVLCCLLLVYAPFRAVSQNLHHRRDSVSSISIAAQPVLKISAKSLASLVNTQGYWRFTCADSGVFANPHYDDSAWQILPTQSVLARVSEHWKGSGWFRLHIECDSALGSEMLALLVNHRAAAEIYIDGQRLAAQGLIGQTPYDEIESSALSLVVPMPAQSTFFDSANVGKRRHIVAVRYSNHTFLQLSRTWFFPNILEPRDAGFDVKIYRYTDAEALVRRTRSVRTVVTMIPLGILLFVAFLYAVFYIFIRRDRTNLYLSLYSISTAFLCFLLLYRIQGQGSRTLIMWASLGVVVSIGALALSQMAMFYGVVYGALQRRFWWLWCPLVVCLILGRFWIDAVLWNNLLLMLILSGFVDIGVMMVVGLRKQVEDVVIIAVGSVIFLVSSALYTYLYIQGLQHILWLYALTTYCAFLSMPITMAFFIARRFARVNESLLEQLDAVKTLSEQALEREKEKQALIEQQKQELEQVVDKRTKQLQESNSLLNEQTRMIQASNIELLRKNVEIAAEREKADEILLNILPAPIAERLKAGEQIIAEKLHDVTVLFADIAGFTRFAMSVSPERLVALLDKVFSEFDRLVEKHNAEKIKTIGDAYMVVGGLWNNGGNHVESMARLAIEMQESVGRLSMDLELIGLTVRIGLHTGEAVAGIIGTKKLNYDLWGDTVNTASRMESHGEAGKIHCTEQVAIRLRHKFMFSERGEMRIKGKGLMHTYFLEKEFDAASDELVERAQRLILESKI